jgi:pSer/pThr/pTyr-binding forkhead associated (FHA) protein
VIDLDSANGTQVNGRDVLPGDPVRLAPGDHIHLGAWTRITLTQS